MNWNWENKSWPEFTFDSSALMSSEAKFLGNSGMLFGAFAHLDRDGQTSLRIDLLREEALQTSEIEGEHLNRESLQISLCRHFGLQAGTSAVPPSERGISEMMIDLHESWETPLSCALLCNWNRLLLQGRADIKTAGRYRIGKEPMQILSGPLHNPVIHFQAPPSTAVPGEMETFIEWFNQKTPLSALAFAGIAHLRFVSIHPFEDGNGRIARALSEKALAQKLEQPLLLALSQTIQQNKKAYYTALAKNSRELEITGWLEYFAQTVLAAQARTLRQVEFVIGKGKLYARLGGQLNPRQQKVLDRMFREGPDGFAGGLSAANCIAITKSPRATVTRDLQDLVAKGALTRTGELRHTRYHLHL